jgi:hypothetical protein
MAPVTADSVRTIDWRPALFARFRDLTALRYDYPVVLLEHGRAAESVRTLSAVIDELLSASADEPDGGISQRLWRDAQAIERWIRTDVARGDTDRLSAWLEGTPLDHARSARELDGEVIDCDADAPARVLTHIWAAAQAEKRRQFQGEIEALTRRLREELQGDAAHSQPGLDASRLQAAFASPQADLYDFASMARVLATSVPAATLSTRQRHRIETLIEALESQTFYADAVFAFTSASAALDRYRRQYPKVIDFVRTMAMTRLEVDGRYNEARHDPLFETFDALEPDPGDLARFPEYLVCMSADCPPVELAAVMEIFATGLPIKVLLQTDDLLDEPALGDEHLGLAARSRQLTAMAMGQNDVYVVQAPASHLVRCLPAIVDGIASRGPALFSVFSGAGGWTTTRPYLVAAAAAASRVFPVVTFNPAAGPDSHDRLSIDGNPQPDRDWPVHAIQYEDAALQRAAEEVPFTAADFLAADERFAAHIAPIESGEEVSDPLLMVDEDDRLHRVRVDGLVVRETARCLARWRVLQSLAARRGAPIDRAEATTPTAAATAEAPTAASDAPAPAAAPPAEPASPADPYIETARCTTCDECRKINDRMFAYNANRQAYIANPAAGTYAQLVEAAESCQVSIIHPGQPRDPNEPGLEDLLARAAPFM